MSRLIELANEVHNGGECSKREALAIAKKMLLEERLQLEQDRWDLVLSVLLDLARTNQTKPVRDKLDKLTDTIDRLKGFDYDETY